MVRLALSAAAYLIANAVGLLLAVLLLQGFQIDALSFVVVVVAFSVIQAVLGPLITKISLKHLPQLMGGVALVTVSIGLLITDLLLPGMSIGGVANWLGATLLVVTRGERESEEERGGKLKRLHGRCSPM